MAEVHPSPAAESRAAEAAEDSATCQSVPNRSGQADWFAPFSIVPIAEFFSRKISDDRFVHILLVRLALCEKHG